MAEGNALDTVYEADRPAVALKIREAFEQGTATVHARLNTKTGIRDFRLNATRAETAKGTFLVGVATDITERKRVDEELHELQARLSEQALRDPLTGLYNRRYFDESMRSELIRAARIKQPIGIVLCDLDYFKDVNDTYGHQVGDEVLRVFADLLLRSARGSDIVCRLGGEEFVLLFPDMPLDVTYRRAEELRATTAAMRTISGGAVVQVTASFGVAAFPRNGETGEALVRAADAAMYQAKEAGRDCVVASSACSEDVPGDPAISSAPVSPSGA